MDFDWLSFLLGLIVSGAGAWLLFWGEKCSLANRIAYNCCENARESIAFEYARYKIKNPEPDELDELEEFEKYIEQIYPIENEKFIIKKLPELTEQSDVHIEDYLGVYTKVYDMYFLIEEIYNCENCSRRYMYYLSDANFNKGEIIKTPYDVDIVKYLK